MPAPLVLTASTVPPEMAMAIALPSLFSPQPMPAPSGLWAKTVPPDMVMVPPPLLLLLLLPIPALYMGSASGSACGAVWLETMAVTVPPEMVMVPLLPPKLPPMAAPAHLP